MIRGFRPVLVLTFCAIGLQPAVDAQVTKQAKRPMRTPVELRLSPSPEPSPLFRHRLLPPTTSLRPGDAAQIYLRIRLNVADPTWEDIETKHIAWAERPLDAIPLKEAHDFLATWESAIEQIESGTRRQTCHWDYAIGEKGKDIFKIQMPDLFEMMRWSRLLTIKARVQMADGRLQEAIGTIGTGLAFGRHVGQGPFSSSSTVGSAIAGRMLEQAEELIGQPGAPNLYWALSSLPRPLVPIRDQIEQDMIMGERVVPELVEVDAPRPTSEWPHFAARLHAGIGRFARFFADLNNQLPENLRKVLDEEYPAYKKRSIETMRDLLVKSRAATAANLVMMTDDQIMARGMAIEYRILRDETFRITALPFLEARERLTKSIESDRLTHANETTLGDVLKETVAKNYGDIVHRATTNAVSQERRVALLRVIEAIRLHMAKHEGQFPETLDALKDVPVPLDPATGRPFPYTPRDNTATLAPAPVRPILPDWPEYRLVLRK